jgi:hypothetical protein
MLVASLGSRRFMLYSVRTLTDALVADGGVASYRSEYALKTVTLRKEHDGWSAGTLGVIIEPFEDAALVEISGEYGVTLATVSVPYADLDVIEEPAQEHLAI